MWQNKFKFSKIALALVSCSSLLTIQLPTRAENVCKVMDPTGTPLYVLLEPNRHIINSLVNGTEVYIEDTAFDEKGRPWAKVGGYSQGQYRTWGWVFREFISCYQR